MFVVYILHSQKLDKFYIGTTDDFDRRFKEHNSEEKPDAFSLRGRPWTKFLVIENLRSEQAYKMEDHIKRMKSKTYIMNLKKYPEMIEKLKLRYF